MIPGVNKQTIAQAVKPVNPEDYGYATGRIRALEASLLSDSDVSRVFEATRPEDISRIIQEKGYESGEIELALKEKLIETYEIIAAIIPDQPFVEALLLFHDSHNLKVILKYLSTWWTSKSNNNNKKDATLPASDASLSWHGLEALMQKPSLVDPVTLFKGIRDQDDEQIPQWLYALAEEAASLWLKTYDIGSMDMLIDKKTWARANDIVDKLNNKFLQDYLLLKQDLLSLEILLRCRVLKTGSDYMKKALPPASSLSEDTWLQAYHLDAEGLLNLTKKLGLEKYFASEAMHKVINDYGVSGTASAYSKSADQILLHSLQKSASVLRGPEVPIAYLLRRELEIRNIRIALTCLRNGIPTSQAVELSRHAVW